MLDGAAGATPLPVTATLRLFLGAVAVLQAGAVLHAVGLTRGALAMSAAAAAAWTSVAGVALFISALCRKGDFRGSREDSTGLVLSAYSATGSAPTEDAGPSAAATAAGARQERDASGAAADGGGDHGDAESGWVVRAVMASEILALLLLVFLRGGTGVSGVWSSSSSSSNSLLNFFAGSEGSGGSGVSGGGSELVAACASVLGQWLVSAVVITATAAGSVVLPPTLAALATAHVADTFAPAAPGGGTTTQSRRGSGWHPGLGPDAPAGGTATPPTGEKKAGLRRSTSSSAIATADAQRKLVASGGGGAGKVGAASNTRLASPVAAKMGAKTGGGGMDGDTALGVDDGERTAQLSPPPDGLPRRRMPAIHLAEATLRLVVSWGGAVSLVGGCWAAAQPPLAFLVRNMGVFVSAVLRFPFSRRTDTKTAAGGGGAASPAGGPGRENPKKKKGTSSQQAATAPKKKKKSNPSISPPGSLAASGGTGGISQGATAAATATITAPSTVLPLNAEPKSTTVPPTPSPSAAEKGAGKAVPAEKQAPASLEQQYADAAVAIAARWKSVVAEKAHRWRIILAKKIMPAAAREDQGTGDGGSTGGGRTHPATVTAPAAPIFAAPVVSFAAPRSPPPPPPPPPSPPVMSKATPLQPAEEQQQEHLKRQRRQERETRLEWEVIRSLPEGQSSRGWLSAIDCAIATVYASRHPVHGSGGAGTGSGRGVCGRLERRDPTPPPPSGKLQALTQRGGRQASAPVAAAAADDDVMIVGGGDGVGPTFVSTAEVALLWVVLVAVWATVKVEYRLARRRRWGELSVVAVAKIVAAGE